MVTFKTQHNSFTEFKNLACAALTVGDPHANEEEALTGVKTGGLFHAHNSSVAAKRPASYLCCQPGLCRVGFFILDERLSDMSDKFELSNDLAEESNRYPKKCPVCKKITLVTVVSKCLRIVCSDCGHYLRTDQKP